MKIESKEIFIPGPSGRIQAKYLKSKQRGAPVALVLQPHPQYGGTMNNRIVYETYNCFYKNKFSVITGCNRGIGLKILETFSENGANIFACSRNFDDDFKSHINQLEKKNGNKILVLSNCIVKIKRTLVILTKIISIWLL